MKIEYVAHTSFSGTIQHNSQKNAIFFFGLFDPKTWPDPLFKKSGHYCRGVNECAKGVKTYPQRRNLEPHDPFFPKKYHFPDQFFGFGEFPDFFRKNPFEKRPFIRENHSKRRKKGGWLAKWELFSWMFKCHERGFEIVYFDPIDNVFFQKNFPRADLLAKFFLEHRQNRGFDKSSQKDFHDIWTFRKKVLTSPISHPFSAS